MRHLRLYLMLAVLAVAAGVGACSDTGRNAEPAGPTWDCGGYLGGGGGKALDSTGVCPTSTTPPPTDSI
jgi:hypothetical protein